MKKKIGIVGHGLNLGSLAADMTEEKPKESVIIVYDGNDEKSIEGAEKAKQEMEAEGKLVKLMTKDDFAIAEKNRETFGNPNKRFKITNPMHEELMELPIETDFKRNRNVKKPSKTATYHPINTEGKTQRNDSCPCGSGKKYKKCCIK